MRIYLEGRKQEFWFVYNDSASTLRQDTIALPLGESSAERIWGNVRSSGKIFVSDLNLNAVRTTSSNTTSETG